METIFETVAAVSTPPGKGGIAVIRISGPDALSVGDRVFFPRSGALSEAAPRRATFGAIRHPETGEEIDQGVAVCFRAPASFTGEDTVEISCHGGTAVTRAVLSAVLAAGAACAGPGDFTRRAFIHGKMTLSEAEAVGLLIDADTESRRALASGAARGNVSRALEKISDELTNVLSALYAAIDYPEEDVGDEGERNILSVVERSYDRLEALRRTYRTGHAVTAGLPAVITGVPNSGKSSLYNLLLGREDAIVTDIPGTTRDILSAAADVGGVTLLLSDTAGIRDGGDAVEQIGVSRAREKLAEASLILFVVDASVPLTQDVRTLLCETPDDVPRIVILNKSDAGYALSAEEAAFLSSGAQAVIPMSASTGAGRDELAAAIGRLAGTDTLSLRDDAVIWDARQEASLARASALLREAADGLTAGEPLDALCTLCESALSEVAGIDGRAVDEAIIDGIFARFCVGK